jgi:regulator of protease activity HflC (stomatin/prohibitin superfamily)
MVLPYFTIVRHKSAAVLESFGRFERVLHAGGHLILPWQSVAGRLSLRVQELQVSVETKTEDDVFVRLLIAVQYFVIPERVREAFYELANPVQQIESYIFDEVRSAVPRMPLDEVFQNKDQIADGVKTNLEETMTKYGYGIVRALVNDIDPDAKVKEAMNEINAATRMRKAAEERGEAERVLKVKQAQGDAQSTVLQGEGIAGQRKAIIQGLRESVEEFQEGVPGATAADVMQLILLSQYFEMLKEVGGRSKSNTIMLPHTPGGLSEIMGQLREALVSAGAVNEAHADGSRPAAQEFLFPPTPTPTPPPLPKPKTTPTPAPSPAATVDGAA